MLSRLPFLLCLLLAPGLSAAQVTRSLPGFDLQRLQLESSGLGSLVVGTGRTLAPGDFRVSVEAHYEHMPLNFRRAWDPIITNDLSVVENKFTTHVTAAVGVLSWLQVGAQVPFIVGQRGNPTRGVRPPDGQGLGTPWVSVRAAPWQMKNGAPLNLGVELAAGLPVGREDLLGRDTYAVHPSLQLGLQGDNFQVGGELGALLRPRHDLSPLSGREQDVLGNELRLGLTVTARGKNKTSTRPELSLLMGVPLQGGRLGYEVLVGVRKHLVSGLDLYFLGGPGLGTSIDMPAVRLLAGASFTTGGDD
ncbi:flagellar motor protein MotB [Archangium sp.]|uniref:flagellar motor protein MotB n=1 Tax=Archangium sp. TaxID=1872627 RepID=UPI002EDB7344